VAAGPTSKIEHIRFKRTQVTRFESAGLQYTQHGAAHFLAAGVKRCYGIVGDTLNQIVRAINVSNIE
jgi:hypothetical protein